MFSIKKLKFFPLDNSFIYDIPMNPTISKKTSGKVTNNGSTKGSKPNPMAARALAHLQKVKEEEERLAAIKAEEERKIKEEEEKAAAAAKAIEDAKLLKKEKKQAKIAAQKEAGTFKTAAQKKREKEIANARIRTINTTSVPTISHAVQYSQEIVKETVSTNNFRCPITCVMGHVDTGKTTLMDKIRDTKVQEGEVAGITQQIGATFIPKTDIIRKMNNINNTFTIPGLLMIDTPGHEAFSNLRIRGSSLADIVILVIDLVHGLEKQTIESLNILTKTETKFVIALNKIDRLFGWNSIPNSSIHDSLTLNESCKFEFRDRLNFVKGQLQEQGVNAELFWDNKSPEDTISICPISAITGEGIPDLLNLLITTCETNLVETITVTDKLKCVIMEKTAVDGLGITVDALLISGTLKKGDNIYVKTTSGTVRTQIRNLLTPPPNCESRVTTSYDSNASLTGAIGFKLVASNIENIIIGSDIIIASDTNEEEDMHFGSVTSEPTVQFNLQEIGILVYASTEGSLEALMHHLQVVCNPPVPVSAVYVGNVMKKHITKMIISNKTNYKELNSILAFDVEIDNDASELAKDNNITIITDGTIFRLYGQYEKFRISSENERKDQYRHLVVYPCVLKILKDKVFRKKGPFIFGVNVIEGSLRINTPLIIPGKKLIIGRVVSIQHEGKDIDCANKESEVCIKVEEISENNYTYGRQFDSTDILVSHITRTSVDAMKTHFKNELIGNDGLPNETARLLKTIATRLK
jgi:translation initiation factor aIF-2/yIF-2